MTAPTRPLWCIWHGPSDNGECAQRLDALEPIIGSVGGGVAIATVVTATGIGTHTEESIALGRANAAHIVRCVNAHEALVAALERIAEKSLPEDDGVLCYEGMPDEERQEIIADHPDESTNEFWLELGDIRRARKALALAKG